MTGIRILPGRIRGLWVVISLAISLGIGVPIAYALFADPITGPDNLFSTARIFEGERTTPAFDVRDASSGAEFDVSNTLAFDGDGRTTTTKAWSSSFSTARYVDVDLNGPLPGGLTVSGATFSIAYASTIGGATSCIYLDVRIRSTDTVLGTFGSSGSPLGCVTGKTLATISTSISSAVSTTDTANDLRIRVYSNSSPAKASTIDLAVVSGSSPDAAFTLYPSAWTDAADGTPAATRWGLAVP